MGFNSPHATLCSVQSGKKVIRKMNFISGSVSAGEMRHLIFPAMKQQGRQLSKLHSMQCVSVLGAISWKRERERERERESVCVRERERERERGGRERQRQHSNSKTLFYKFRFSQKPNN